MNASETATEMLKFVTCVRSSLQAMNSRMSGWSTRSIPMLAPRRVPPCLTTSVEASYSFMNDTGPEATPIVERTTSFLGRRREHEARRQLAQRPAGVHERGRVRHPHPRGHQLEERFGEALDRFGRGAVAAVRLGDGAGDPPEQVFGLLDRRPLVVLHQVAPLQHGDGVGAQIERPFAGGGGHAGSSLTV